MSFLESQFLDLKNKYLPIEDGLNVKSIHGYDKHKLGLSASGLPLFFIECIDANLNSIVGYNFEMIQVKFNQKCQILIDDQPLQIKTFTIIELKNGSESIQSYFLDIIYLMLQNMPMDVTIADLKEEIKKLIILLSCLLTAPRKTIQGLWAELLLIEQAVDPSYILNSWHFSPNDLFDFNDGSDKIEVKSTSRNLRVHRFSMSQLVPNINSKLLIASFFAVQTENGKSVFDLSDSIESRLNNPKDIFKLKEKIAQTLGNDFNRATEVFFDYQLGIDSCEYYSCDDIPKILSSVVPQQITNVSFDVDLSNIKSISSKKYKSKLFDSLRFRVKLGM